jgi:hypothetical protein
VSKTGNRRLNEFRHDKNFFSAETKWLVVSLHKGVNMIKSTSRLRCWGLLGMPLFLACSVFAQPAIYPRRVNTPTDNPLSLDQHDIVLINASGGARIVNLPSAAGIVGRHYTIKKTDNSTNLVKIFTSPTTQTIDGQDSQGPAGYAYSLTNQNQEVRIVSDGSNWKILSAVPKNVVNAEAFAGDSASAKIIAARDSCPPTGCVVDARGLQGAQTISETITLGLPNGGGKPVQLLLGAATFTTTACPAFELKGESTILEGLGEGKYVGTFSLTTIQVAASGCSAASGPLVRISIDAGVRGGTIRRLRIDGQRTSLQQGALPATAGIEIFASQTFRNTIEDVTIGNVKTGILVANNVSSHRMNRVVIAQVGTGLDFGQVNMRDMVVSNSTISGDVQAFLVGSTGGTTSQAVAFTNCDMTASPSDLSTPNWIGQVRNVQGFHITGGWYEYEEPPRAVSSLSRTNNVVTVTTVQPHQLTSANAGKLNVTISNATPTSFECTLCPIAAVINTTQFTYNQNAANDSGSTTSPASISAPSMIVLGTTSADGKPLDLAAGSSIMGAHFVGNKQVSYAIEFRNASYPAVVYNDFNTIQLQDVLVTYTQSEGVYWGNQLGGATGLPVSRTDGLTAVSPGGVTVASGRPMFPLGINTPSARTGTADNTDLAGICQLSGGSGTCTFSLTGTYSSTNAPICVATDTTSPAGVVVPSLVFVPTPAPGHWELTLTGTGAHTVNWICIGRN